MKRAFCLLRKIPVVIPLSDDSYLTPSPYSRQKKSCNLSDLVQLLC